MIKNSRFLISNGGTGISGTGLASSSDSLLLVTGTIFEIGDSGLAVSNTDGDSQLFRNILVRSQSDGITAFSGAGSCFKPRIENARIELSGNNSVAFKANNGKVYLENSYVNAGTGFTNRGTFCCASFYVNHSTIEGSKAVSVDNRLAIRFGASQIKSLTIKEVINGTIDATCAATYDRNFADLDAICE